MAAGTSGAAAGTAADRPALESSFAGACQRFLEATSPAAQSQSHASGPDAVSQDACVQALQQVVTAHLALTAALAAPPQSASLRSSQQPAQQQPSALPDGPSTSGAADGHADAALRAAVAKRNQIMQDAALRLGQLGCSMRAVLDDTYAQAPTTSNGYVPSIDEVVRYGHKLRDTTFHTGVFPGEPAPTLVHMAAMHTPARAILVQKFYVVNLRDFGLDSDKQIRVPMPPEWQQGMPPPQASEPLIMQMIEEAMQEVLSSEAAAAAAAQPSAQGQQAGAAPFEAGAGAAAAAPAPQAPSIAEARRQVAAVFLEDFDDSDEEESEEEDDEF